MKPIELLKKAIDWLVGSFETGDGGASARKMTAFSCVMFAAYCHKYATPATALHFLIVDLSCALLALGIVTFEQIIKLKQNGNSNQAGN